MDPPSAVALARLGGRSDDFTSTRLDVGLVNNADLVLGLAVEHRSAVLRISPRSMRRVFTLAEFCRLSANVNVGDGSSSDARRVVLETARQRGLNDALPAADEDVADPLNAPDSVVQACSRHIHDLVEQLMGSLGFHHPPSSNAP